MKIQIDTTAKTIKVEGTHKITKILDEVKKLLPNGEWKLYSLEMNTVINNWYNPITWGNPNHHQCITGITTDTAIIDTTTGIYNYEIEN